MYDMSEISYTVHNCEPLNWSLGHQKDNKTKNPYSIDEILRSEQGTSGAIDRKRRYSDSDSGEDIDEEENKASKRTSPENDSKGTSYITAAKESITEVQEERNSDDDSTTKGRYRDQKGHIA